METNEIKTKAELEQEAKELEQTWTQIKLIPDLKATTIEEIRRKIHSRLLEIRMELIK